MLRIRRPEHRDDSDERREQDADSGRISHDKWIPDSWFRDVLVGDLVLMSGHGDGEPLLVKLVAIVQRRTDSPQVLPS